MSWVVVGPEGREVAEHRYLREVVGNLAARTAWLPWQAEEPVGPEALARLATARLQSAHS